MIVEYFKYKNVYCVYVRKTKNIQEKLIWKVKAKFEIELLT